MVDLPVVCSLEKQLEREHWTAVAPPIFLRDGWNLT
jgi:hypothetical protein